MSRESNRHEASRWLGTAEEDLRAAALLRDGEMYAQACFFSQQAAEKAVKCLWYLADADPWGHSVQVLMTSLPDTVPLGDLDPWIERAAILDKLYVPTRYPNGLPDLTPGEVYRRHDADAGLEAARWVIESVRRIFEETAERTP